MAGCLRDAVPDAWGQHIILGRLAAAGRDFGEDMLTFMHESASDRIGALDFQASPVEYLPRGEPVELDELLDATVRFAEGAVFSEALSRALLHGTSVGGARPKALFVDRQRGSDGTVVERHLVAKFSLSTDTYPVVKAEAVATNLARRVGLDVASSALAVRAGRDVLLVANTDDHARNHAAFWDGAALRLTPAYDLSPQMRPGRRAAEDVFNLSPVEADEIIAGQVATIREQWGEAADECQLTPADRQLLWARLILNPGVFYDEDRDVDTFGS